MEHLEFFWKIMVTLLAIIPSAYTDVKNSRIDKLLRCLNWKIFKLYRNKNEHFYYKASFIKKRAITIITIGFWLLLFLITIGYKYHLFSKFIVILSFIVFGLFHTVFFGFENKDEKERHFNKNKVIYSFFTLLYFLLLLLRITYASAFSLQLIFIITILFLLIALYRHIITCFNVGLFYCFWGITYILVKLNPEKPLKSIRFIFSIIAFLFLIASN